MATDAMSSAPSEGHSAEPATKETRWAAGRDRVRVARRRHGSARRREFKYPGWSFAFDRGEDGNQFKLDETLETEALLIGRVTYESFAGAWPKREGDFADKFNTMPKYVVSSTLEDRVEQHHGPPGRRRRRATKLKEQIDGIVQTPGSLRLVQTLLEHDLVEGLHLMVFPVILGTGRRLFGATTEGLTGG